MYVIPKLQVCHCDWNGQTELLKLQVSNALMDPIQTKSNALLLHLSVNIFSELRLVNSCQDQRNYLPQIAVQKVNNNLSRQKSREMLTHTRMR